tara:strand:- start:1732 stop:2391 length:660 start_codon:yes stop_codon:yes gene_type:complete
MNIIKFLLIDAGLVLLVIPLLSLLLQKNKNIIFFQEESPNEQIEKTFSKPLDKETILELEKSVKSDTRGIELNSLLGNWKFNSIFEKNIDSEDSLLSSLLRVFSANLELRKDSTIQEAFQCAVITSIKLGFLSIEFCGIGDMNETQSLLTYFFNVIQLKLRSSVVIRRSLNEPKQNRKPFFQLIALEKDKKLLLARGQGGGLVLWLKDSMQPMKKSKNI